MLRVETPESTELTLENRALLNPRDFLTSAYYTVLNEIVPRVLNDNTAELSICVVGELLNDGEVASIEGSHLPALKTVIDSETNFHNLFKDFILSGLLNQIQDFDLHLPDWKFGGILKLKLNLRRIALGAGNAPPGPCVELEMRETAFASKVQTFAIKNLLCIDINQFFDETFPLFKQRIEEIQANYPIMKIGACLIAKYIKDNQEMTRYIQCECKVFDMDTEIEEFFVKFIKEKCSKNVEEFEVQGSGWSLDSIIEIQINISEYDVHRGASYIPTPKFLHTKKAVVNVKNEDEMCFVWAILSALNPTNNHPERTSKYIGFLNQLNITGLQFPMSVNQIGKFEALNPLISVNVYMFDDEKNIIYPIRLTKSVKVKHIHLLLTSEINRGSLIENISKKCHYSWIKNLSRLLSAQVSKRNHSHIFCDRCLQHFQSNERLNMHIDACMNQNFCRIVMPEKNILEFNDCRKELEVPFIVYADVESILKPTTKKISSTDTTSAYQEHETYSVGYYFHCRYDNSKSYYKSHRGPDCIKWFANELYELAGRVALILYNPKPLNMSPADDILFENAENCHICKKKFQSAELKVRDHDHISGTYRGAAHGECNIQYQDSRAIPVVFHNLSGYDSHFIIKEMSTAFEGEVTVIPVNDQKYISFIKQIDNLAIDHRNDIYLKFIDSFRFMAASLDKLSSYLPSEEKMILKNEFNTMAPEKRALLERKGVFPYDYVDSWGKLEETALPPREAFYSKLMDEQISDDEYEFAHKIWDEFNINSLGEYSDLYLKTDILLLADVFENFRSTCMKIYKLDPAHYFTSPGFSWDAMLKYTKVKIELLTDVDMLMFVERGMFK